MNGVSESARVASPTAVPTPGADDPRPHIAAAVTGLDGVDDLPLTDAVVVFDDLHNELQNALADLDRS